MKRWFARVILRRKPKEEPPVSNWPLWVSLVIFCFNVEFVVTPFILNWLLGMIGEPLRLASGLWATGEMGWWVFFSNWLASEKMKKVGKSKLKDVFRSREQDNRFWSWIKGFIKKHFLEDFDLESYKGDKVFRAMNQSLREYGYFVICLFILATSIIPGCWVLSLTVTRITKWWSFYVTLLGGNFIKNYYLAYIYEELGFGYMVLIVISVWLIVSLLSKRLLRQVSGRI